MTLFEIDDAIRKCFVIEETDEVVDTETGEIFDASYLDNLQMQRDKKIENISKWIKNLDSDIEQLKAQKDSFAKRQKTAETKRDSLKGYLSSYLNGEKWDAPDRSVAISFRKSEAVSISDESIIPKKWFIKQDPKLDKAGIRAALKKGLKVKGATLTVNNNIQIK